MLVQIGLLGRNVQEVIVEGESATVAQVFAQANIPVSEHHTFLAGATPVNSEHVVTEGEVVIAVAPVRGA